MKHPNGLDREMNEFKVGDIIEHSQFEYFEVVDMSKTGKTLYLIDKFAQRKGIRASQCTLTCPNEWRMNKHY